MYNINIHFHNPVEFCDQEVTFEFEMPFVPRIKDHLSFTSEIYEKTLEDLQRKINNDNNLKIRYEDCGYLADANIVKEISYCGKKGTIHVELETKWSDD